MLSAVPPRAYMYRHAAHRRSTARFSNILRKRPGLPATGRLSARKAHRQHDDFAHRHGRWAPGMSHTGLPSHRRQFVKVSALPCPLPPVRGGGKVAQRPACLPSASTPDVPLCATARAATAVVLSRRSALDRVQQAVPTPPAGERGSAYLPVRAAGLGASDRCTPPERHFEAFG